MNTETKLMQSPAGVLHAAGPKKIDRSIARFSVGNADVTVMEGDLIFGNRLSWMQAVMNVSGEYLTHSGVLATVDGELVVIELGPNGCFTRTIESFTNAYRFHAVGRLQMHPQCRSAVAGAAEQHLRVGELSYSVPACSLLEAFMLVRRYAPRRAERAINLLGLRAAGELAERTLSTRVTCSGFVYECLAAACADCRPAIAWPTRQRVAPWCAAPSLSDVRPIRSTRPTQDPAVVRTLVTPYDLWAAVRYDVRFVVDGDVATVIHDYIDMDPSPMSMQIAS